MSSAAKSPFVDRARKKSDVLFSRRKPLGSVDARARLVDRVRPSSFVCDDSMNKMSVARRSFCLTVNLRALERRIAGVDGKRTRGPVSFYLAVSQPTVSTGACMGTRILPHIGS